MVKVRPFETPPATAQWGRTITYPDYNKMLQGFRPQSMDDKWSVYTDTPEDDGQSNAVVHAYFGVKNHEHLCLTVAPGDPDETEARDWATITKISWKVEWPGGMQTDEEKAKELAIAMCKKLLKCAMEN